MNPPARYLVEVDAFDPNTGSTTTLRYATVGYVTAPTATPASTYYDARIAQPIDVGRHLFRAGATWGSSEQRYGDLVLLNPDGELDALLGLGLDGRAVRFYRTTAVRPAFPDDFQTVLVGTVEQPEFQGDTVVVKVHDRRFDLSTALQASRYAGTNVLPEGLEGTDDDLRGTLKPVALGVKKNIPAPCVNTARLIYQVNDGACDTDAVYDRGAALTQGSDYADQTDMEANAPSAGAYRAWPAGGYFRLGSSPAGQVTADITQGATAGDRTAAQLFLQVVTRSDVVSEADVSSADLALLDAADDAELGYWTRESESLASVCDRIAGTVGAWWGVDRTGVFRIQQLARPRSADAVLTLTEHDLLRPIERLATQDPGLGIPVYRQVLQWGRLGVTQTSDLDAGVSDARRAELAKEWREVVAQDDDARVAHLLSPEVSRDSLYTTAGDAVHEVGRRLSLYNVRRDRYELVVALTDETYSLDLGDTILLSHPRYELRSEGAPSGSPFRILGVETDARNARLTLTVWGSSTGADLLITRAGESIATRAGEPLITRAA